MILWLSSFTLTLNLSYYKVSSWSSLSIGLLEYVGFLILLGSVGVSDDDSGSEDN